MLERSTRVGIALGTDSLTAVFRAGSSTHVEVVPFATPASADVAAAIQSGFERLAARAHTTFGREPKGLSVTVALLPPHADVRLIALPPLRRAEAEAVLRRDAARHFVGGPGARVVAVRPPPPARRHEQGQVLTAAASAQLVEAIRSAALHVGWRVQRLVPAHAAWLAAAERGTKAAATPLAIIAQLGDTATVLRLERATVRLLRRIPAADIEEIVSALGSGPGAAAVFADGIGGDAIARALAVAGWNVTRGAGAAQVAADEAQHAALELRPESVVAEREEKSRILAGRLIAGTAVLLLAIAAVHLWGAQRELDAVRARRAALRPQVAPLLETRDSLDRLRQRTDELRALAAVPQWTRALFDIAMLLPPDAHLLSLRGTGDTLMIAAEGERAGAALQALRGAASLTDVRLQGPIERDLEAGATTLERFTVHARVVADTAGRGMR